MQITWIIGNGFDKAMGYPTTYKEFYQSMQDNNLLVSNNTFQQIVNNLEKDKLSFWADLEEALGKITIIAEQNCIDKCAGDIDKFEKMVLVEKQNFTKDILEISEHLLDYLDNIEMEVFPAEVDKRIHISSSFINYYDGLKDSNNRLYNKLSLSEYYEPNQAEVNLFSFNYTEFSTRWFNHSFSPGIVQALKKENSKLYNFQKGEVLNIHGSLETEDIIIGCNDNTQYSEVIMADILNKLKQNENLASEYILIGEKLIEKTKIFVTFGVSFGETDNYWWNKIIEKMINDLDIQMIIYHYDESVKRKTAMRKNLVSEIVCEKIVGKYSEELSIEQKKDLYDRISVVTNTNKIFRI